MRVCLLFLLLMRLLSVAGADDPSRHELTVTGTQFRLDGKLFPYTGVSFFNAIYNPAFNRSSEARREWLQKFSNYGINVLRVWCQWDNKRGFVDSTSAATMYSQDGNLKPDPLGTLKSILADADALGFVIELVLFSQESWRDGIKLESDAADKAVATLTSELKPHRNLSFQIWNEFSERVHDHVATIKRLDPTRLVTNSPGGAGVLGDAAQNRILDYLTPHTTRQGTAPHWKIAPKEIERLLLEFRKPVVDDEPARNGTARFGGPKGSTYPADHIVQILSVWILGGFVTYHHDMFQTGAGSPSVPPSGVPDPEFSPYHRQVFEFLKLRDRYLSADHK